MRLLLPSQLFSAATSSDSQKVTVKSQIADIDAISRTANIRPFADEAPYRDLPDRVPGPFDPGWNARDSRGSGRDARAFQPATPRLGRSRSGAKLGDGDLWPSSTTSFPVRGSSWRRDCSSFPKHQHRHNP